MTPSGGLNLHILELGKYDRYLDGADVRMARTVVTLTRDWLVHSIRTGTNHV